MWSAWGPVLTGYAGFFVLERIVPARPHPGIREFATDIRANLLYFLINPAALILGSLLAQPVARMLGGPLIQLHPGSWTGHPVGRLLLAFIPFLIYDLFYYWFHRCQHSWSWLWQVHKLHHSGPMTVTTNYRHHWLEDFFRTLFIALPMNWIVSIGPVDSVIAALLIQQWTNFSHANIKVGLGPLTGVISGPQYHRVHHSIESQHFHRNYAAFFPIWDRIFGTYWEPAKDEWPAAGLTDTPEVWSTRELLFSPFLEWAKSITESSRTGRVSQVRLGSEAGAERMLGSRRKGERTPRNPSVESPAPAQS